jgi:hypothetical protein
MATKKQQRRRYQRAKEHQRGSHDGEVDAESGQKPERAARRAALFAIVVFIMFQVLPFGKKLSSQAAAIEAAAFFLWLIPLQYLIDRWKYNRWLKSRG